MSSTVNTRSLNEPMKLVQCLDELVDTVQLALARWKVVHVVRCEHFPDDTHVARIHPVQIRMLDQRLVLFGRSSISPCSPGTWLVQATPPSMDHLLIMHRGPLLHSSGALDGALQRSVHEERLRSRMLRIDFCSPSPDSVSRPAGLGLRTSSRQPGYLALTMTARDAKEALLRTHPRGHDMATEPAFEMHVIESGLTDGYWIQAVDVDGDGRPDILTSGLSDGHVSWYQQPRLDQARHPRFPAARVARPG